MLIRIQIFQSKTELTLLILVHQNNVTVNQSSTKRNRFNKQTILSDYKKDAFQTNKDKLFSKHSKIIWL